MPHSMVFAAGRWACQACGAAHRRPQGALAVDQSACPGRHRLLEHVHATHQLLAGWLGDGCGDGPGGGHLPFVMCAGCGYFASSRIVGLSRECTRHATPGRRKWIERATGGLHPIKSVREVVCGLKPLPGWAGTAAQVGSVCNPAGQQHVGMRIHASALAAAGTPSPPGGGGHAVPV